MNKEYSNNHRYNSKVGDSERKTVNDSTGPATEPNFDTGADLDETIQKLVRKTKETHDL